jgi:hypothetical protein
MKMNFKIFKKGKPIYWILGAIAVFIVFYMIASRGSSSGGSVAVVGGTAQADNTIALANAEASMRAGDNAAAVAIATLQAQGQIAETQAGADVAKYIANLEATTSMAGFTAQMEAIKLQSEYGLESSRVAAETQLGIRALDAAVLSKQLDTNASMFNNSLAANVEMSRIQSDAFIKQSALSVIPTLKKKDRDETLQILGTTFAGGSVPYYNNNSGPAVILPHYSGGTA